MLVNYICLTLLWVKTFISEKSQNSESDGKTFQGLSLFPDLLIIPQCD